MTMTANQEMPTLLHRQLELYTFDQNGELQLRVQ